MKLWLNRRWIYARKISQSSSSLSSGRVSSDVSSHASLLSSLFRISRQICCSSLLPFLSLFSRVPLSQPGILFFQSLSLFSTEFSSDCQLVQILVSLLSVQIILIVPFLVVSINLPSNVYESCQPVRCFLLQSHALSPYKFCFFCLFLVETSQIYHICQHL